MFFQTSNRAFQVNCVPKNDGSHHQVEAAGPLTLFLEAAIAHFAQTVEEHSLGQRVLCLAFIQTNVHASSQLGILQPVECKYGALNSPKFTERNGKAVLAWVASLNDLQRLA